MISFLIGLYTVIALAEAMIFLLALGRWRDRSYLTGAVFATLVVVLLLIPDSSIVNFLVSLPINQDTALYLVSILVRSSHWGVFTYGVLTLLPLLIGRIWTVGGQPRTGTKTGKGNKRK